MFCLTVGVMASQPLRLRIREACPTLTLPSREEGSVAPWSILQRGKLRLLRTSSLVECWLVGTGSRV